MGTVQTGDRGSKERPFYLMLVKYGLVEMHDSVLPQLLIFQDNTEIQNGLVIAGWIFTCGLI